MKIKRLHLYIVGLLSCAVATAVLATTPVAPSHNVEIGAQAAFNLENVFPDTVFQYQEPSTTTAQFAGSTIVQIPALTSNVQINTATLFPGYNSPILIGLQDVTNPGVQLNVGQDSGGNRQKLAANGFMMTRLDSGFPVFFVDNASVNPALVKVFALSN